MEEEYRDLAIGSPFDGLYSVSNTGKVWSKRSKKLLSPQPNGNGYLSVGMKNNGACKRYKVHRLVALMFVPNADGKTTVNHIDGDVGNNNANNLEWATRKEQSIDMRNRGSAHKTFPRQRSVLICTKDGTVVKTAQSLTQAASEVGRSVEAVYFCLQGRQNTCGGYVLKYGEEQDDADPDASANSL